jgi:glycerol kinase
LEQLRGQWGVDHVWKCHMESERREQLYANWKKAVTRSFGWVEERGLNTTA